MFRVFLCICLCVPIVFGQFGFYPNDRRYRQPYQYGFSENVLNPRRIQQKLSSLLSFQPETDNSNAAFIYPFNNRPISNNPYKNYDNNYYQSSNVRFPTLGENVRPAYPGDNTFGPDYKEVPKQPNGLTFQDFIKPSPMGENTNEPENPEKPYENDPYEPITNRPVFDKTTQKINYDEVYKPGFSNHSSGIIMGSVSNNPVFGSVITPDSPKFDTSSKPSFEDRNGEEETTLPTLTPVPPSDARQNMNFGPAGIFKNTCETLDGGVGNCIKIQECDIYYKLLKDSRDKTVVNILRKSQCGFEGQNPKVCCPLPGIPDEPPAPQTTTVAPTPQGKSVDTDDVTPVTALPEPPVCGVSEASFSRVVNGVPAKLGDFPWMALLGYHDSRGGPETRWKCGGSLVTQHHVFTAAHCIHGHEDLLYVVRLGELDLASENDGAAPIDVLIKSKIKHENYDSVAYTNDVGLLILDKDVQFTKLIKPICIPQNQKLRSLTFEKYNPLIAGWGDVAYRGPSATHLQVAQVPVVSNSACKETYKPYKKQVIDERVLCAGWKDGRQDACQGDSGGPLMQPIWNSETYQTFFYQIGIVSFGNKCAEPGFPGVYTRVTHFVPWLEKRIIGS
ncbi:venom serine protease Bi-VSP [Pieris rapae]|uniref:venom serine protease Bi-VSP n=1 Tax=Pieris rapae TaxID=64459 RepID=UPI001E27C5DB|nr:venom serine protease Bi-VSP [Pieris rapae]